MTARAWGWVAHLRDGGTAPWSSWTGEGPEGDRLPGAQQLELLRRLNLAGFAGGPDTILAARPAGRGRGDLPLIGEPHPGYGDPAVDPSDLPDHDLLRVAADLLAPTLSGLTDWLDDDDLGLAVQTLVEEAAGE